MVKLPMKVQQTKESSAECECSSSSQTTAFHSMPTITSGLALARARSALSSATTWITPFGLTMLHGGGTIATDAPCCVSAVADPPRTRTSAAEHPPRTPTSPQRTEITECTETRLTLYPSYPTVVVIGSGEPLQSPLRPPGTDVKVGTESKGDGELPPSRWWSELTVIHNN